MVNIWWMKKWLNVTNLKDHSWPIQGLKHLCCYIKAQCGKQWTRWVCKMAEAAINELFVCTEIFFSEVLNNPFCQDWIKKKIFLVYHHWSQPWVSDENALSTYFFGNGICCILLSLLNCPLVILRCRNNIKTGLVFY